MKVVTRHDWKATPLSENYTVLQLNRKLSADEHQFLQQGFKPRDMDDRWFVYTENGWVYLHRSWTGNCIFQIKMEPIEGNYLLTEMHLDKQSSFVNQPEVINEIISNILKRISDVENG